MGGEGSMHGSGWGDICTIGLIPSSSAYVFSLVICCLVLLLRNEGVRTYYVV